MLIGFRGAEATGGTTDTAPHHDPLKVTFLTESSYPLRAMPARSLEAVTVDQELGGSENVLILDHPFCTLYLKATKCDTKT